MRGKTDKNMAEEVRDKATVANKEVNEGVVAYNKKLEIRENKGTRDQDHKEAMIMMTTEMIGETVDLKVWNLGVKMLTDKDQLLTLKPGDKVPLKEEG
jgi:hypothetical protein